MKNHILSKLCYLIISAPSPKGTMSRTFVDFCIYFLFCPIISFHSWIFFSIAFNLEKAWKMGWVIPPFPLHFQSYSADIELPIADFQRAWGLYQTL